MASSEEVKKLASLARIRIPEEKAELFAKEFEGILAYVGKLDELKVSIEVGETHAPIRNVFRADEGAHEPGLYTEKIVDAFPQKNGTYLSVKQIITHD